MASKYKGFVVLVRGWMSWDVVKRTNSRSEASRIARDIRLASEESKVMKASTYYGKKKGR